MSESAEQIVERIFSDNAGQTAMQKHAVKTALTAASRERDEAIAREKVLERLLSRYLNWHQPHMIAHEAETALSATASTAYDDLVKRIAAEEREACAKVAQEAAEPEAESNFPEHDRGWENGCLSVAAAIRQRAGR